MNPHTARCLQLSTAIGRSPNRHRPRRVSDTFYGYSSPAESYHSKTYSEAQLTPASLSGVWPTPSTPNSSIGYPYTPETPYSASWLVRCPTSNMQDINSKRLDGANLSWLGTNTDPFIEASWDTCWSATLPDSSQTDLITDIGGVGDGNVATLGLGMRFPDCRTENDIQAGNTPSTRLEDFADPFQRSCWVTKKQSSPSPHRQSASPLSSVDGLSDLPQLSRTPSLASSRDHVANETSRTFPSTPDGSRGRRRRSLTHAPVPRPSSSRNFRRSPYPVGRARSNSLSVCSSVSAAPLSLPTTSCCSPVEECQDEFSGGNWSPPLNVAPLHTQALYPGTEFFSESFEMGPAFGSGLTSELAPHFGLEGTFSFGNVEGQAHRGWPSPSSENKAHEVLLASGGDKTGDAQAEPDLFGPLSQQPLAPSDEDMSPEDPEMIPVQQGPRFDGDLYTPQFVRGQGNKREGFCGLCKPGRWLVLKNSAFWYDKSFSHGISAATGRPFDGPRQTRRMHGNSHLWEGLCGTCNEWIALISNKKKGTTWFRHAYKCHSHKKVEEVSKKRRHSTAKSMAEKGSSVTAPTMIESLCGSDGRC